MGRKIVVTSGKGGVGKSTVCANIGRALAVQKNSVVLLDGDIGLNNLDVVLGVETRVMFDLDDVLSERCTLREALVEAGEEGLFLLPSSKMGLECQSPHAFQRVVEELSHVFDFVLIDSPAGIEVGFHRAVLAANEAVVVTTPHISAVRDADKVLAILAMYKLEKTALVVNRVRKDLTKKGAMMSPFELADLLRVPLVGAVPDDDSVTVFGLASKKSASETAFLMIASAIKNGRGEVYDCEAPSKFWQFWKRR